MSIDTIPVEQGLAYYEFEVELDGVQFRLEFRYVDRDDAWYLSIYDVDGIPLRMGLRVVPQWPLLQLWADENRPGGEMISLSQGGVTSTPTLDQLGSDAVLVYMDEAEVLSLA